MPSFSRSRWSPQIGATIQKTFVQVGQPPHLQWYHAAEDRFFVVLGLFVVIPLESYHACPWNLDGGCSSHSSPSLLSIQASAPGVPLRPAAMIL